MEHSYVHVEESEKAHFQGAESRRPEYLKRSKRSLFESDPSSIEGGEIDVDISSSVGITVSPNKGRRLKLFQETSEESFEESLMAGGYGRYVGASDLVASLHMLRAINWASVQQTGCNSHHQPLAHRA
jgi:hypothetical protein